MEEKYKILVGTPEQVEAKLNKLYIDYDINISSTTQSEKKLTIVVELTKKLFKKTIL